MKELALFIGLILACALVALAAVGVAVLILRVTS